MGEQSNGRGISAFVLHLLAMAAMLCDHLWVSGIFGSFWLTCVGRLAYPIFAFLIAEGFMRTSSVSRYMKRMLLAALFSEIPFDLMRSGTLFDPFHQNVLWTFFISLGCLCLLKRSGTIRNSVASAAAGAGAVMTAFLLGNAAMVDYYGPGVLMVLVFYFFRGRDAACRLGQLAGMYVINCILLGGTAVQVKVWDFCLAVPLQGFAMAALLFIWLYHGRQGPHSRSVRILFYAFYPIHMLALAAAAPR